MGVLIVGVAGDADGRAAVLVDESDLAAGESNCDVVGCALDLLSLTLGQRPAVHRYRCSVLRRLSFRPVRVVLLQRLAALGDDGCERPSAPAQLAALARMQSDIEDQRADRDHMEGQAVPPPGRSRGKHTRIHDSTHALPQVLRDTGHVALDHIAGSHPIRGQDVAQFSGLLVPHEGDVGASVGIVLDPLHDVRTGIFALEVNDTDPPLGTTAAMPDGDPATAVSTTP